MVLYGMVNVDLYSAVITKVSNVILHREGQQMDSTRGFFFCGPSQGLK